MKKTYLQIMLAVVIAAWIVFLSGGCNKKEGGANNGSSDSSSGNESYLPSGDTNKVIRPGSERVILSSTKGLVYYLNTWQVPPSSTGSAMTSISPMRWITIADPHVSYTNTASIHAVFYSGINHPIDSPPVKVTLEEWGNGWFVVSANQPLLQGDGIVSDIFDSK